MKTLLWMCILTVAAMVPAFAQVTPSEDCPLAGSAVGQVQPQQPAPTTQPSNRFAIREQRYYGGAATDLARGNALRPSPYAQPRSPEQNPAIDLTTRRPRGVVLFSFNF